MVSDVLKGGICMMLITSSFAKQEIFTLKIGDFEKAYPIQQPQSEGLPSRLLMLMILQIISLY